MIFALVFQMFEVGRENVKKSSAFDNQRLLKEFNATLNGLHTNTLLKGKTIYEPYYATLREQRLRVDSFKQGRKFSIVPIILATTALLHHKNRLLKLIDVLQAFCNFVGLDISKGKNVASICIMIVSYFISNW